MYGFHDFQTATKLAERKTKETGQQHCVLHAEDVDGPGGMFTLGVYPQHEEISGVELIKKVMGTLGRFQRGYAGQVSLRVSARNCQPPVRRLPS